jgi:hypothetical protein
VNRGNRVTDDIAASRDEAWDSSSG